jgi:hypothetical protein
MYLKLLSLPNYELKLAITFCKDSIQKFLDVIKILTLNLLIEDGQV